MIISPNPAVNITRILLDKALSSASMEIYDANGKLVHKEDVSGRQVIQLSVASFARGLYQVRISGSEILVNKTMIISK